MSHPMWVCGLKLGQALQIGRHRQVTPHVGVWIETIDPRPDPLTLYVTPHVGVWIETLYSGQYPLYFTSHTPCGCVD